MCIFICIYVCVLYRVHAALVGFRKGIVSPGTGVISSCMMWVLGTESRRLEGQSMLWTAESSDWPVTASVLLQWSATKASLLKLWSLLKAPLWTSHLSFRSSKKGSWNRTIINSLFYGRMLNKDLEKGLCLGFKPALQRILIYSFSWE